MMFDKIGYDMSAAEASHQKLKELETFVLDQLQQLQNTANAWRAVSTGSIKENADLAVATLDRKSKQIGQFANLHGATGVRSTGEMLATDRQLGSRISFG